MDQQFWKTICEIYLPSLSDNWAKLVPINIFNLNVTTSQSLMTSLLWSNVTWVQWPYFVWFSGFGCIGCVTAMCQIWFMDGLHTWRWILVTHWSHRIFQGRFWLLKLSIIGSLLHTSLFYHHEHPVCFFLISLIIVLILPIKKNSMK